MHFSISLCITFNAAEAYKGKEVNVLHSVKAIQNVCIESPLRMRAIRIPNLMKKSSKS